MNRWADMALSILAENPARLPRMRNVETVETVETAFEGGKKGVSTIAAISTTVAFSDFEERAAIIEEGAQVPRDWAEGFAHLAATPCPVGVSVAIWRSLIDAAGRSLDSQGGR